MILVELNGGLGNQMFQYAASKSLAMHHNTQLKLDITPGSGKNMPDELRHRPFDLHYFNLPDGIATTEEIDSFTSTSALEKITEKSKPNYKRKVYREPFFHFDTNFFNAGPDAYLKGLWQSEKYFLPFKDEIRKIFSITSKSSFHLKYISDKIKDNNSVAIHIRRGDYLAKISLEVLGLIPLDHYNRAIEIIRSKIPNPAFYFFSDDINWTKENLSIPGAVYISEKISRNHFEDLYLMSQCKHNIIANSSFSWWGAWLNDNHDKMVIAPQKWFNKGPKDTQDLIPDGWMKI